MKLRASDYNDEPGLLVLTFGRGVIKDRQLMGVLRKAIDPATDTEWIENTLRAIRRDPFLRR